jgi:hypothetical protein
MAGNLTAPQVGDALKRLGNYRVIIAQEAADEGPPDGIGGHHILALGLRETGLRNINNPADTDHGWCQISEIYHREFLASQPGCPEGTWRAVTGHTADETGYCPRFTPALSYALEMLKSNKRYGETKLGLSGVVARRFAVAAYNCGLGGAIKGQREGNVDKYTTGGDYSAWTEYHAKTIYRWLEEHPNWKDSD